MTAPSFMVIAGEASGDGLAAELVMALRRRAGGEVKFFGAGGPRMAEAGVELAFDMTRHAVVGLLEVIRHYGRFRRLFRQLLDLALERRPDILICVDFSGFNRRFARALRRRIPSGTWRPAIIQYVSPQVWASRPKRAEAMARDFDLLLAIFPFEKEWYARRTPAFPVEFVGHPIVDRYADAVSGQDPAGVPDRDSSEPLVLLLPGSRKGEIDRHVPVLAGSAQRIAAERPARFRMILPTAELCARARERLGTEPGPEIEIGEGRLAPSLREAALALACTGTVTMECARFGVCTVALYKTSWSTYQIGRRIIQVPYLAMPNLLANEAVFPEFIQDDATPERIAGAALELLNNPERRAVVRTKLARIIGSLGQPGASDRAAEAILRLMRGGSPHGTAARGTSEPAATPPGPS